MPTAGVRRKLFDLVTAVSLALFVAVTSLGVRSYWVMYDAGWTSKRGATALIVSRGRIGLYADSNVQAARPLGASAHANRPPVSIARLFPDASDPRGAAGFFAYRGTTEVTGGWNVLTVPAWSVAALSGVLPMRWAFHHRRERRARSRALGLCPTCGYDCRATPEAAREGEALLQTCPECGTDLARSKPRPPT